MDGTLQFKDGKALEAWLKDKPVEWSKAIAARSALRVFPLLASVAEIDDGRMPFDTKQHLILSVWRAIFISWAARKYPAHDMRATAAPARAASASASAPFDASASAASAAASASASATAASARAAAASAAASAADAAPARGQIWASISADCRGLETDANTLIDQDLWLTGAQGDDWSDMNAPAWVREALVSFETSELARTGSWSMISAWYRALLPAEMGAKPRSLFGETADVEIAMKPDKFWRRKPDDVVEAIAEIANWKPSLSARVYTDLPIGELEFLVKAGGPSVKKGNAGSKSAKAAIKSGSGSPRDPNDPVTPPPGKEIPPPPAQLREDVRTHSDEPTARDRLGRRPFAQALVERMDDVRGQGAPDGFAVHIHAPWGAGKTSILLMMEQVMTDAARPPDKQWAVVHFNAWKNERRKPPWWPLIQQTYACCRDSLWKERSWRRWLSVKSRWMIWRFRADLLPYAIAALVLLLFAYFWSSAAADGSWLDVLPKVLTEGPGKIFGVIAALVAAIVPIVTIARAVAFGSPSNAQFYSELSSDPLKRIAKLFRSIVVKTDKPVAIFIDDLDRCHADYVVDLLEGIQTLFRGRDVAYVVAADRGWIKAAFESRYGVFSGDVGDAGQPLGYLFLEKIFQISTPVPGMGAQIRQEYWDRLIEGDRAPVIPGDMDRQSDPSKAEEAETKVQEEFDRRVTEVRQELKTESGGKVTSASVDEFLSRRGGGAEIRAAAALEINVSAAAEREAEHLLSRFQGIVGEVPRVMKRMINAFAMRRAIGILEGSAIPQEALVRWTILEQRWPALADLLISNPEWLNDLAVKQSTAKLGKLDPALQPFANRPPVQSVLGRKTDGGLTPDLVSAIIRGSANDPGVETTDQARIPSRRRGRTSEDDQPQA